MRTIIVAETPGKYISFSFEKLRRNKKELKIACWNGEGKINLILENFKTLTFISCHKIEYCMKSERPDVYLRDLLVRLKRIEKSTGIFITNKDFNLEKNISEINQFKDQNDIKIITLK